MAVLFTFNKQRREYIKFPIGLSRPAWAPISREFVKVPGRIGAHLISTETDIRAINIPVKVESKGGENLQKLKEDLAEWLVHDDVKELVFDDEPDRTYYAVVDGTLDLDEIVYYGKGVITFICPEGVKYGPLREIKLDAQTNKIYYAGTAPVIPEIEIIPSEKTTYAGYTDGEKSVLVGYPMDVETMPYDKEPIFFNNVMSDRSNWTDATSMHGITVGGSYSTSSYGLFPIAYGTGTTWHGPSVIRTLNEALTDFTLSTYIGLANTSLLQMSKLEWHLLSADNEIQARILFGDFWAGYNRSIAEFYIGNPAIEKKIQLLDDRWTKDFKGVVQIRKEGNRIELYVARTTPSPHHQIKKTVFIDTENRFSKPITKIQLATCQWGANPTADPRYIQVLLRKINPSKNDMIPYIADGGDKITIDKALNVRKNDQLQLGLNVFSEPIELQKGENTLIVLPPTADVTVRFREVFK